MEKDTRTTKRQRELLAFIDAFIKGNNYGPSYREIMRALGYKSVSTVATHIDGLIAKGYLRKRDNSARSIEVLNTGHPVEAKQDHRRWLMEQMNAALKRDGNYIEVFTTTLEALNIDHDRLELPTKTP